MATTTDTAPPTPAPGRPPTIRRRCCRRSWRARGRCSIRRSCGGRLRESFVKLNPRDAGEEPGDVRGRSRRRADDGVPDPRHASPARGGIGFELQISAVAVVHGAVRELRRGHGGGARQGAGRLAAQDEDRRARQARCSADGTIEKVPASQLRAGDVVICEAGELIPGDGEVIEGIATVDESVITGESAPVIRESGGDRSAVTGGTRVLSDQIKIQITSNPGETFLDRMIALVEGAERQKTPNEIALNILIAGLTLIFLLAVVTLQPFAAYSVDVGRRRQRPERRRAGLAAGLPDPDDHRRPALGHRHRRHGPRDAAQRAGDERQGGRSGGRREHAAARQDRHDHARQSPGGRVPAGRAASTEPSWRTPRSCRAWPTRRRKAGRSWSWPRRSTGCAAATSPSTSANFIPFSAYTRMSGVDLDGRQLRKGATDAIVDVRQGARRQRPAGLQRADRPHLAHRRHAAGRGRRRAPARHHSPEGHRQGRHEGAHRAAARDGHPHRDDHRRQPADRRGDRQRSRRGRFPGAGHAEGQARIHQEGTGRQAAWSR